MNDMSREKTENFRLNVKALCSVHGQVKQTAEHAAITREYLSMIIHGKAVPTLDVAIGIAEALDMPLGDLVEGILEPTEA